MHYKNKPSCCTTFDTGCVLCVTVWDTACTQPFSCFRQAHERKRVMLACSPGPSRPVSANKPPRPTSAGGRPLSGRLRPTSATLTPIMEDLYASQDYVMSGRASPLFPEAATAYKVAGTDTIPYRYTIIKAMRTIGWMIAVTSPTTPQMPRSGATEKTHASLDVVTKPTQAQLWP